MSDKKDKDKKKGKIINFVNRSKQNITSLQKQVFLALVIVFIYLFFVCYNP